MCGRHLHAAATPKMIDRKVDERRINHPDIEDMRAVIAHTHLQRLGKRRRRGAHIPADDDVTHHRIIEPGVGGVLR